MKALCWQGKRDIRCEEVPDPIIEDPKDAVIRITSTCICGSDLHLMTGIIPGMCVGDVLGHEPMGEVVEVGPEARARGLNVGDPPISNATQPTWESRRHANRRCDNSGWLRCSYNPATLKH